MSLNHNIVFLAAVFGLAGCASPDIVQTRQINDDDLSCSQLVTATKEAQKFEADAREGRTVTGTNVAAALFWWPGLVATYVNTDDAIDAADDASNDADDAKDDRSISTRSGLRQQWTAKTVCFATNLFRSRLA